MTSDRVSRKPREPREPQAPRTPAPSDARERLPDVGRRLVVRGVAAVRAWADARSTRALAGHERERFLLDTLAERRC